MFMVVTFDYRTPEEKAEVLARVQAVQADEATETPANRAAVPPRPARTPRPSLPTMSIRRSPAM